MPAPPSNSVAGFPQLAHLIRTRFLADPPWACLPRPRLEWHNEGVVLRPRESTDVGVANLAGFVLETWQKGRVTRLPGYQMTTLKGWEGRRM